MRNIGKGSYATVYLVQNKKENALYAAKVFLKENHFQTKEGKLAIEKEISILRKLDHQNLLKLKEVFITKTSVYLITNYLSGPSLETQLWHATQPFTKQAICTLMKQLLTAVEYYQNLNIMHRDLKPSNLIFKNAQCQQLVIIDFGLAEFTTTPNFLFPRAGTPGFIAPEIANNYLKHSNYNELCDVFSLGCIMHKMVMSKEVFTGSDPNTIFEENKNCQFQWGSVQYEKVDPTLIEVLKVMLAKDSKERASVKDVLRLELFSSMKTLKQLENKLLADKIKSASEPLNYEQKSNATIYSEVSGEITVSALNQIDQKDDTQFENFAAIDIEENNTNSLQGQTHSVSKYLNYKSNYSALAILKNPLYQSKFYQAQKK